jgi:hypothetical protein
MARRARKPKQPKAKRFRVKTLNSPKPAQLRKRRVHTLNTHIRRRRPRTLNKRIRVPKVK